MESKKQMGLSPAVLANRNLGKNHAWCQKPDIEFDQWCDLNNPKTILCKDVIKAASTIKEVIPKTPLEQSRFTIKLGLNLYYKFESFHRTGSERGSFYSLMMLSEEKRRNGVITASLGNWAMALAYYGQKLNITVTAVLPAYTSINIVEKCKIFGATVILFGENLAEAKRHAFVMIAEKGGTYMSSYDHPNAIAGAGTVGLEILEQLPETDAILVPVGGGGLIAGIAAGIEPNKSCCFFKAMENECPYQTAVARSVAESLMVPTAGYNAFHTAKSLIDKMVLVDDDWIARAILHFVEDEKHIVEGAGATSLCAILAVPEILPELRGKNVVCVITGGNIDHVTLSKSLERAKVVEGRLIKLTMTLPADRINEQRKVLSVIANLGCNILQNYIDRGWTTDNNFFTIYLTLIIETTSLKQACTLKRVMERLFPNICNFLEEPFSPTLICACFPRRSL